MRSSCDVHRPNRRRAAAALALLAAAAARGQTADTYLPWEGGPAYYAKWSAGPPTDPDFFPIGVWLQDPALAAEYKAIGVNQFIGLWRGPTEEQLARLSAAGMPALAAQNPAALASSRRDLLRGWTLRDEPDNAQPRPGGGWGSCVLPPAVIEQYRKLVQADGTRPVFLNLGQGVVNDAWRGRGEACRQRYDHYPEYIGAADIVSYDVYPVNSRLPLWYVGAGVDRLRQWAHYQKAVWNFIETTAIREAPKPSPEQIRSEVWLSLIHGSMGIEYFCHQFRPSEDAARPLHDPETRQGLAAVNREITSLARVLNSRPVANGVIVSSSNPESPIDFLLKRQGGATYLLTVGARPGGATTATFRLRDGGDLEAEVLGESRTIPVRAGVFRDRFENYQVHLYQLPFDPNAGRNRR